MACSRKDPDSDWVWFALETSLEDRNGKLLCLLEPLDQEDQAGASPHLLNGIDKISLCYGLDLKSSLQSTHAEVFGPLGGDRS